MSIKHLSTSELSEQAVRLLDLNGCASYLNLSYWTIRQMIHRGELPAVRVGRRLLIDLEDIDDFIEANKSQEEPF